MTIQARRQLLLRSSAAAVFLAAAAQGAFGQTQVATLPGDESNDYFGYSAASLGDVNADGIADFGVGGYRGSVEGRGRIKVYSGLDGALIHHILGPPSGSLGLVFEVGDVDDDGHDDFGGNFAFYPYVASIFSGLDGSVIATQSQAFFYGGVGDVDQDGHADYVARAQGLGAPFQVTSGATGLALLDLVIPSLSWFGGHVGDLSGDGVPEYATITHSGLNSGAVEIRSGADTTIVRTVPPTREDVTLVVGLGDMDQDGTADFGLVFDNNVSVDILSGIDGSVLASVRGIESFAAGLSFLSSVPDADADGYDDFVVASDPPRLYSGKTGAILAQFAREVSDSRAWSVAGLPDANGDGRPEIVAGNPAAFDPVTFSGTAALFSYDGPAGVNYCTSRLNSTGKPAVITASGSSSLTRDDLFLTVHDAPSGSLGIFLMGDGQQQIPLGNGLLCVGAGGAGISRLPAASIDGNGHMLQEFDLTTVPTGAGTITAGSTRNFQAWFRDSSPAGPVSNLSDAVSVTFSL